MMENEQFNITGMLKVIKKRFYILILVCLIAISIGIIYGKYKVHKYYETATTIIVGDSTQGETNGFNIQDSRYLNTYTEFLTTDIVLVKTIKKLGLNISTEKFKNSIIASHQQDSQFINIKLKWDNSTEGKQILETLISIFGEEINKMNPTLNVMIMNEVKEPKQSVSVKQSTIAINSVLVGIILSLLIIYGLEFMDDTIKEDDEIEKYLNLQLLGNIPKDKNMINNITIEALNSLNYSLAESYRILRTNIEFSSINKKVKSLIVTSPMSGDGKSISSAMLAVFMAFAGKKTIWVDCDLRNSKTKNLFNIDDSVGFTNVLLESVTLNEAIKKSEIDNLYILTSGVKPLNAAEVLCSEKTKELIDMLNSDFEYVIIDTPPVGLMTDARILSKYVDGCLLVIPSGKLKIKEVIRSKRLIELVQGRILGVVLNKYPHKIIR